MGQDKGTGGTAVTGDRDPEQIREEIEQTREALGDTVQALAAKTDLKAQLSDKLRRARDNPVPFAILGTVVAGFLVSRMLRRR